MPGARDPTGGGSLSGGFVRSVHGSAGRRRLRRALACGLLLVLWRPGGTAAAIQSGGAAPPGAAPAGAAPAGANHTADAAADDAGSFALLSEQAGRGDPQAALDLGLLYDLGRQVPRDPVAALHWYLRAAQAGIAQAEFNAAVMYDSGVAGPRDAGQAALWYARAAAHGHARAEYDLAQMYEVGDGVPRNPAMAAAWFRAAAAAGVTAAAARAAVPPAVAATAPVGLLAASPADAALHMDNGRASLELVWQAPPQPVPVIYDVEVVAVDGAILRDVCAAGTDRSALLATLPAAPGRYAWRVYAVSDALQSYVAAPWTAFAIPGTPAAVVAGSAAK